MLVLNVITSTPQNCTNKCLLKLKPFSQKPHIYPESYGLTLGLAKSIMSHEEY